MNSHWNKKTGRYVSHTKRGVRVSLRTNAMMLELHSLAALAGHTGLARQDARIKPLVKLFTSDPVYVTKTARKKPAHLHYPHTPAWEGTYTSNSKKASLNPQNDAKAARALLAAWRSRKQSRLSTHYAKRIQRTVKAVASGRWYKHLGRAKNQINWNTEIFAANFEINGDKSQLPLYSHHLKWFIDQIGKPSTTRIQNLSRGYGFRFYPLVPRSKKNGIDTVEYANIVYSTVGFYDTAVRAGMKPLDSKRISRLRNWSKHILFGTWTHAGYPNWDSGLGHKRRHISSYAGYSLDGLVRGSRSKSLLGSSKQQNYVKYLATTGVSLFKQTQWGSSGELLKSTNFGSPNGFKNATATDDNPPLIFVITGINTELYLGKNRSLRQPNSYSYDRDMGRLAVSTPYYNTAIISPNIYGEGGIEPTRIFDRQQRPVTTIAAGKPGAPATKVELKQGSQLLLSTQPGLYGQPNSNKLYLNRRYQNKAGVFKSMSAFGKASANGQSITLKHSFTDRQIVTSYKIKPGAASKAVISLPIWSKRSLVKITAGVSGRGSHRTANGKQLKFEFKTSDGATGKASFRGIPRGAHISIQRTNRKKQAYRGAKALKIAFKVSGQKRLIRTLQL